MFAPTRLLAILGLLASLAAFTAGFFADRWLPLDLLTHFRLQFAGASIAFAIAIMMPRLRLLVALAGLVATLFAVAYVPARLAEKAQADAAGETVSGAPVRLISFNAWTRNRDWKSIQRFLERERADVVVLVEIGPEKEPLFDAVRELYPWQTDCTALATCRLAILSRHPWSEARAERATGTMPPVIWAQFGEALGNIRIYGTHLTRPPRIRHQLDQTDTLAARLAEETRPLVIAGDFNATPWSLVFNRFTAASGLRAITGLRPTWPVVPVALPQVAIDHVFASDGIATTRVDVGPLLGSDHLPVVSDIVVKSKEDG